jgi:tetratricopeptide (TPR) repeat protein
MNYKYILILILIITQLHSQPVTEDADFRLANGLFEDGFYSLAESAWQKYINRYPQAERLPRAMLYLGDSQFFQEKFAAAISSYRRLQAYFPETTAAQNAGLRLGQAYLFSQQANAAVDALRKYGKSHGDDQVAAFYWLGEAYYEQQQYSSADSALQVSLTADRRSEVAAYAWQTRAHIALAIRDTVIALLFLDSLHTNWPENEVTSATRLLEANLLSKQGRKQAAEASYSLALKKHEGLDRGTVLHDLANHYLRFGQFDNAIRVLGKIRREYRGSPDYDASLYALGWALQQQGENEKAAEVFKDLLASTDDPELSAITRLKYGYSLQALADSSGALLLWEDLLSQSEDSLILAQANYELGQVAFRQKRYANALDYFMAAASQSQPPLRIAAYKMVAETYLALDRYAEADAYFARVVGGEKKWLLESAYQQGWLAYRDKRWKEAAELFGRVYENAADTKIKWLAAFWLGELKFYQDEDYTTSAGFYRVAAAKSHEKRLEALFGLAWSEYRQGNLTAARETFNTVLRDSIRSDKMAAEAWLRLGDIAFALKQYGDAYTSYVQAGRYNDHLDREKRVYAITQSAQAQTRLGEFAQADKIYSRAMQLYPQNEEEFFLAQAELLFIQEDYAGFISRLENRPIDWRDACTKARADYGLGDAAYNLGRYADALRYYEKAMLPGNCGHYRQAAWEGILFVALLLENPQLADSVYLALGPGFSRTERYEMAQQQAELFAENGFLNEAQIVLTRSLENAPNGDAKARTLMRQARVALQQGNSDAAEQNYAQAFAATTDPELKGESALAIIAMAIPDDLDDDKWLAELNKLSGLNRDQETRYRHYRLHYLIHIEAYGRAKNALQNIPATEAEEMLSLRAYAKGRIALHEDQRNQAKAFFNEVIKLNQGKLAARAQLHIAAISEAEGEREKALEEYLLLRYLYPRYEHLVAQGMYEAIRINLQLDRREDAEKINQRLQADYGSNEWAKAALRLFSY